MLVNDDKTQINKLFQEAEKVAIITTPFAGKDALDAGIAIYETIASLGNEPRLLFSGDQEALSLFKNAPTTYPDFGYSELNISFNYKNTPIEKVSYLTENDVFKMKIFPIDKNFDTKNIALEFAYPKYDLLITLGAEKPSDFGSLYEDNLNIFKNTPIINLDISPNNQNFAVVNIVEPQAESLASLVFFKIGVWGYFPTTNAINALLVAMAPD